MVNHSRLALRPVVDRQLERVVDHPRHQLFQDRTGLLDAGICIHFDQPRLKIHIHDKVVSENLKRVRPVEPVYFIFNAIHTVRNQLFHPRNDLSPEIEVRVMLFQITLQHIERKLVAILELAVFLGMFLNGVVSEVNKRV